MSETTMLTDAPRIRGHQENHMTASPAKLRDGSWGARVSGAAKPGDIITIRTAAGKEWQARVQRVLWSGDGVSICSTYAPDRAYRASARGERASPGHWLCACGEESPWGRSCWECGCACPSGRR